MWQAWAEGCASSVMSSTPSTRQTSAHLVRVRVRVRVRLTLTANPNLNPNPNPNPNPKP